jgi:hypothetical protein
MTTNESLPRVSIEDLLRMIGDREVTLARQASLIEKQAARLAELEPVAKDDTATTAITTTQ